MHKRVTKNTGKGETILKKKTLIATSAAVLAMATLGSGKADATPMLSMDDGLTFVTVTDNGAGDSNPLLGSIDYLAPGGTFLNYSVVISVGTSKPVIGSAGLPHLDLASVNVTSLGATSDVLTIKFTDTDFTDPMPSAMGFVSAIGGVTDGTVTYSTYYDTSNTAFGEANSLSSFGPYSAGAFSGQEFVPLASLSPTPVDPYSITLVTTVSNGGGGGMITSYNASVDVPEPSALLLLGSGMLGFALIRRRTAKRV